MLLPSRTSIFAKEGCMRFAVRQLVLGILISMCFAGTASAQYLWITTDNPADSTRMNASGTTVLTFKLDSNHDRNGSLQTCNSHTVGCGNPTTAEPLDVGGYHLLLHANGGTVTFGTFAHALGGSVLEENRNSTDYIIDYNLTAYAGPGVI